MEWSVWRAYDPAFSLTPRPPSVEFLAGRPRREPHQGRAFPRSLALGFWNTKEDAEQYHRAEYQKVHETIRHLLESEPVISTFNVHASTSRKIAAGKAAGGLG